MNKFRLTRYHGIPPTGPQQVWTLRVVALGLDGAPSDIFVYQKGKSSGPGDLFVAVASVTQLHELGLAGVAVVAGDTQQPYYRTNEAKFACQNQAEADQAWNSIVADVQALAANLDSNVNLEQVQQIDVTADAMTEVEE